MKHSYVMLLAAMSIMGCRTSSSQTEAIPPGAVGLPMPSKAYTNILTLDGDWAQKFYAKLDRVASQGQKTYDGDLFVNCKLQSSSLPERAQGFPPPAKAECLFIDPPRPLPPGTQGFPGRGTVLLQDNSDLAHKIFSLLKLPSQTNDRGLELKSKSSQGRIVCSTSYCVVAMDLAQNGANSGGIPDGAQGLPIPPDDNGGIPDGAQGLPLPPK